MAATPARPGMGRLPRMDDELRKLRRELRAARRQRERGQAEIDEANERTAELIVRVQAWKASRRTREPSMQEVADLAGVSRQTADALKRWHENPERARWATKKPGR